MLARTAVSLAAAGADIVAPSDMMDGRVRVIREALDAAGYDQVPVMSYAAKYASAWYGPFREAAGSTPAFGDRRSHQMDPGNAREALREIAIDLDEGAELIIVKPALSYLDILRQARDRFDVPLAAYNVSGEYAMVKAAALQRLDRRAPGGAGNPALDEARRGRPDHHLSREGGGGVAGGVTVATMTGRARFLAAANRQAVDATPVWFMRQAGRTLPEYRALREKHPFLTMARTPELAVEATLMPLDRYPVDGAVLFADIMLPLDGMGIEYEIRPGVGPVIANPIRTAADIDRIRVVDPEEGTPYVLEAVRSCAPRLGDRAAALGFAGAPFTLACYLVDGRPSREYPKTKALMYGEPELWDRLMTALTEMTCRYLEGQVRAGADVVQLFDSWLGLLDPVTYARQVAPYTARIFERLRGLAPTIHFSTGTVQLLAGNRRHRTVNGQRRLAPAARPRLGHDRPGNLGIQGNLDPVLLMAPWEAVEAGARDVLARAANRPGHVFNLGHGLHPETDPDQLARLVDLVHRVSAR